jgi:HD-GYP domain-containing protein (c-di-GMP phosphodiesterase class II)
MTSQRPYSRQRSEREAVLELRRCAGAQFDVEVVDAFCMMLIERSGEADAAVSRPGSGARPRS